LSVAPDEHAMAPVQATIQYTHNRAMTHPRTNDGGRARLRVKIDAGAFEARDPATDLLRVGSLVR